MAVMAVDKIGLLLFFISRLNYESLSFDK